MKSSGAWLSPSSALSAKRLARSLVTVLALTLIQTVSIPVMDFATPKAAASTLFENRANFQQYTSWQSDRYNHAPYQSASGTTPISDNSSVINFTQDVNFQSGFLWNTNTFSYANDFSVSASYYFGVKDGNGADMIYFFMKPIAEWPNDGIAGSSTGGVSTVANGEIRAIFDTYDNETEMTDDHLTVQASKLNGAETTYTYTNGEIGFPLKDSSGNVVTNVETDSFHDYTIRWTASSKTFAVYAGLNANSLIYSTEIPSSQMDATSFSFGWAGLTGGLSNYLAIRNVSYHIGPTAVASNATDLTVIDGTSVTWTASYTASEGTPTTRWEYSVDQGLTWVSTGVTGTTYMFTATRAMTQRKYRFYIASTGAGSTFFRATSPVTLTVLPPVLGAETDTALTFDGTESAFTADSSAFSVNAFSAEAWVRPTAFNSGDWNMVLCKDGVFALGMKKINNVWFWHYGLSGASTPFSSGISTTIPVLINEWHHIAITRAANTNEVSFFVDGQRVFIGTADAAAASTISTSNPKSFAIGAQRGSSSSSNFFTGQIDHVAIFNSARTLTEVKSDMNTYGLASSSDLIAYYDFNEGSGSTLFNRKVGAVASTDLSLANGPTFTEVIETSTSGAYTIGKFLRTYLTSTGGWRAPGNAPMASAMILGGGGGGGWNSGGGGSGGGIFIINRFSPSTYTPIIIGVGGRGATGIGGSSYTPIFNPLNGESTTLGTSFVLGGNFGQNYSNTTTVPSGGLAITTASGTTGAGGRGGYNTGMDGVAGSSGFSSTITNSTLIYGGGGGGGGFDYRYDNGGAKGSGGGGAGGGFNSEGVVSVDYGSSGTAGLGGGGGGSATRVHAGSGGSGVVIIRWITAIKPTYTKPSNAYLNVGMTETFTTNVAQDSATVTLTRTFRWESTTPTANGAYTLIKQGTGATNAAFSWVPTDTSTSGSGYLYRLTVTDSDTAGLFITDSSTAFAVINRALVVSGNSAIPKAINLSKSETFTITLGTSTYQSSLSPIIPGITLDTSTAGSPVIRISDTMTVGTYYETLTVTDSVSASVVLPLVINVVPPPILTNTGEVVRDGQVFNLDPSSSASYNPATTALSDLSGSKKPISKFGSATYSDDFSGSLEFKSTSSDYLKYTEVAPLNQWTVETYVKVNSILGDRYIISTYYNSAVSANWNVNYLLAVKASGSNVKVFAGFIKAGVWKTYETVATFTTGTWTHLAATYDGSGTVSIYFDGVFKGSTTGLGSWGVPFNASQPDVFINKRSDDANYGNINYGFLRVYNRSLTQSEITQNFNSTKTRFDTPNQSQIKPSQKYGNLTLESFTATSGFETKTVTFATGSRAGIKWETATVANRIDLSIQESLTVGTYNETITVTDSLGQSTYLPIRMTVTKADSLTVSMDTATSVSYNGSPITIYPRTTIKGFKSSDTATSAVRFSSSLYTESTVVPTNADTYTVRGAEPVFTIGSLSNYEGVIYETRTAVVRKINQRPLNIFKYGGTVGSGFIIQLQGGDGTGAVTETLTGVSTLTGCAISNRILTAAEQKQGFCEVRVVKAGDQNYFAETETAQLYFMAFVNNQPTGQVGSGSTIALNGATSLETSTVQAPSITGLSTLTLSLGAGGNFTITGTGFTGAVTVKFWRNKSISVTSGDGTTIAIPVSSIASAGATSGRIAVITTAGEGVSVQPLTITP